MKNFRVTLACRKCGAEQTFDIEVENDMGLYQEVKKLDLEHLGTCTESGAFTSWKEIKLEKVK